MERERGEREREGGDGGDKIRWCLLSKTICKLKVPLDRKWPLINQLLKTLAGCEGVQSATHPSSLWNAFSIALWPSTSLTLTEKVKLHPFQGKNE